MKNMANVSAFTDTELLKKAANNKLNSEPETEEMQITGSPFKAIREKEGGWFAAWGQGKKDRQDLYQSRSKMLKDGQVSKPTGYDSLDKNQKLEMDEYYRKYGKYPEGKREKGTFRDTIRYDPNNRPAQVREGDVRWTMSIPTGWGWS